MQNIVINNVLNIVITIQNTIFESVIIMGFYTNSSINHQSKY